MKILDTTASVKSIWYQPDNEFTVFVDMRCGRFSSWTPNQKKENVFKYSVFPDVVARWQNLPFKNCVFDMVVFDPPHDTSNTSGMSKKYGCLESSWREDIRFAFIEFFRVLKNEGVLILKWSDRKINVIEVLKLSCYNPLFGTRTGQANRTHWIVFIKHRENKPLIYYS